ncbi:peptidase [Novosphingobium sp. FSY-8]|uniref:Peptidase n=1 Tax=Novosphingobium ovatum TaxID=1908523 RepID=A0ABW9XE36_9SPHN|nr:prepilin peptidase [Novosphingobium ovatum]NBC36800.1 peptidase [Novosphingobium ovatum]
MQGILSYVLVAGLAIALLIAAYTDLRTRRIHNWLNAGIALAAPVFWWASGMGWTDIGWQVALAIGTFAALAVLFALRVMGGGDVKLLAVLALWIKPLWFVKLLTIMAITGGILTVVVAFWHIARRQRDRIAVPYGIAIAIGGLCVLADHYWPAAHSGGLIG